MLEAFVGCLFALVTFSLAIYTVQMMRRTKADEPVTAASDTGPFEMIRKLQAETMESWQAAEHRADRWQLKHEQAVRQRDAVLLMAIDATYRLPTTNPALTYEDAVPDNSPLLRMHFAFPSGAIRCGLDEMGNESQLDASIRITTFRTAVTCDFCRIGLELDREKCWRCGQPDPNGDEVTAARPHTCDPGPRARASAASPGDRFETFPDT